MDIAATRPYLLICLKTVRPKQLALKVLIWNKNTYSSKTPLPDYIIDNLNLQILMKIHKIKKVPQKDQS